MTVNGFDQHCESSVLCLIFSGSIKFNCPVISDIHVWPLYCFIIMTKACCASLGNICFIDEHRLCSFIFCWLEYILQLTNAMVRLAVAEIDGVFVPCEVFGSMNS